MGNAELPRDIPWPAYKLSVGAGENVHVEDHRRARSRPATEVEKLSLPFRTTEAPIEFELALKAHHGLGDWDESLETPQVKNIVSADSIFER